MGAVDLVYMQTMLLFMVNLGVNEGVPLLVGTAFRWAFDASPQETVFAAASVAKNEPTARASYMWEVLSKRFSSIQATWSFIDAICTTTSRLLNGGATCAVPRVPHVCASLWSRTKS